VQRFVSEDYFDLDARYAEGGHPDAVEVSTGLRWQGRRHVVRHDHSAKAPAALIELENAIDRLANSQRWVECATPDGICFDCRRRPDSSVTRAYAELSLELAVRPPRRAQVRSRAPKAASRSDANPPRTPRA